MRRADEPAYETCIGCADAASGGLIDEETPRRSGDCGRQMHERDES